MSQDRIAAVTITEYNSLNFVKPLTFQVSGEDIIHNTGNYNVCIKKLEVPVNSKHMPINSLTESFGITIFNDYKDYEQVIPGLEYGVNFFSIPGPIYSVSSFIRQLNDIVFKKASPVEMGYFELNDETNEIVYHYNRQHSEEHSRIWIYFDPKLQRLFPFDYDQNDKIGVHARFKAVKDYTNSSTVDVVDIKPNEFTYPLFFNLKAIRIRTTLPLSIHKIFTANNAKAEHAYLLGDITFNSETMYNSRNLIYHPINLSYSSMEEVGTLRGFNLSFTYFYADGTEIPVLLDPLDFASIALSFEPK